MTTIDASMPLRFTVTLTRLLQFAEPSVVTFEQLLNVWNHEQARPMTEPEFRNGVINPFLSKMEKEYPGWGCRIKLAESEDGNLSDHLLGEA